MNQNKTTGKRLTLALGIICVLLAAGLGGAIVYYTMRINDINNQLNTLESFITTITGSSSSNVTTVIAQLNSTFTNDQLNTLESFITTLTGQSGSNATTVIAQLNSTFYMINSVVTSQINTINLLNGNITRLIGFLNLNDSTVWVNNETVSEPAGGSSIAWHNWTFPATYAGYVTINVSSASAVAWAHVEYSAYGVIYSDQIEVGTNGTATFPILPSSSITVGVGNGNPSGEATQTATITYYF